MPTLQLGPRSQESGRLEMQVKVRQQTGMKMLLLVPSWIMNLQAQLNGELLYQTLRSTLTVPPMDANSTPRETGKTAKRGRGKLIRTDVDKDSERESE